MTTPTQLRLTEADRAKIAAIQARYGLPSMAAAVRFAVETLHRGIDAAVPKKSPRNSRSTP